MGSPSGNGSDHDPRSGSSPAARRKLRPRPEQFPTPNHAQSQAALRRLPRPNSPLAGRRATPATPRSEPGAGSTGRGGDRAGRREPGRDGWRCGTASSISMQQRSLNPRTSCRKAASRARPGPIEGFVGQRRRVETPQRVGVADRFDEMGEEVELAASGRRPGARRSLAKSSGDGSNASGGIEAGADGAEVSPEGLGSAGVTGRSPCRGA